MSPRMNVEVTIPKIKKRDTAKHTECLLKLWTELQQRLIISKLLPGNDAIDAEMLVVAYVSSSMLRRN